MERVHNLQPPALIEPRPISQKDQPSTTEKAILELLSRWHNHTFWTETPIRSVTERGTLAVLVPFNPQAPPIRIPLYRSRKSLFYVGSADVNGGGNDFLIRGPSIDLQHCMFSWEPSEGFDSLVKITDRSSVNILVNDERMLYNSSRYLQDQDIVTFAPKDSSLCLDFRYVFRYAHHMSRVKDVIVQSQVAPL